MLILFLHGSYLSREALLNREFIAVAVMYVSSWVALNFIQGNLILWAKYVLKEEGLFAVYIFVIQVSRYQ